MAAWQHIHDIFQNEGVSNVIWVWSPNIINPVPSVQLKAYYPVTAMSTGSAWSATTR
ncbi:hypothetical protein GXW82_41620 [Streptacidiphilus sp. 4-A2]|nr:hypothetical protein [Streptacidiphilus sp. 4-A2]